jgi:uncharacterized membrane protein YcjF (UPF0283 family)
MLNPFIATMLENFQEVDVVIIIIIIMNVVVILLVVIIIIKKVMMMMIVMLVRHSHLLRDTEPLHRHDARDSPG